MKNNFLKAGVSLVVIALIVVGAVQAIKHKKAQMAQISPAKTYGVVVPEQQATRSDIRLTVPYLALVQSDNDVNLASKITSRVEMIVNSGSRVKAGDILVKLDDAELQAKKRGLELKIEQIRNQIKAKQTDLESLQNTHLRNLKLRRIQAISEQKLSTEAAKIESLQSTIASMRNSAAALQQNIQEINDTLSYTTLHSPFDGVVSKTFVAQNGIAAGGKPLLTLSGGKNKQFIVRVSDNIKPTQLLYRDTLCPLHSLNSSYHGLNEYSCDIETDLPAGNRVEVKLVVYSGNDFLLPANAVLQIDGKQYVLIVTGDQAQPRAVSVVAEGSEGLVVHGVNNGDRYVVAKPDILLKLMTGVRVIKAQ